MIAADQAPGRRTGALRHFFEIETVRIAARDLLALSGLRDTGRALADLGSAVVAAALEVVEPGVPMAVVGMGSFGGAEIAYGSDLDVLLVYEGTSRFGRESGRTGGVGAVPSLQRSDAGRGDRPDRRLAASRRQTGPARPKPRRLRGVPPALGRDLGAPGAPAGAAGRGGRERRRALPGRSPTRRSGRRPSTSLPSGRSAG